jgi:hypothetical protein
MSCSPLSEKAAQFVSLQHAFHPEEAETILTASALDPDEIAHNKWGAVWTEAMLIATTDVEPVPVYIDEETTTLTNSTLSTTSSGVEDPTVGSAECFASMHDSAVQSRDDALSAKQEDSHRQAWRTFNLLETVLGASLTVAAVGATVGVEVAAALVYILAVVLHHLSRLCYGCLWLGHVVLRLLSWSILLVDSVLLVASVLVTELIALVAGLLTTLMGGPMRGLQWHQYVRKLCLLSRWAFRDFHQKWTPSRVFASSVAAEGEQRRH